MSRKRKRVAEMDGIDAELIVIEDEIATLSERRRVLHAQKAALEGQNEEDTQRELLDREWNSGFDWDAGVEETLRVFGHSSFRPLQREAVNGIFSGNDVFTILPTGAGKSLVFQLPALHWKRVNKGGVVMVVSPLLSLMSDQVRSLQNVGITSAMLCSATSAAEKRRILNEVGEGVPQILYTTPEFLVKAKTLLAKLQKCSTAQRLKMFVIDEAHCCSTWGHDFRPDYMKLSLLRQNFPSVPILCLTATATAACSRDVTTTLCMKNTLLLKGNYNRANIRYCILEKKNRKVLVEKDMTGKAIKQEEEECVVWLLKYCTGRWRGRCGIVYCLSCRDVEKLVASFQALGGSAVGYHGQMPHEDRSAAYSSWFEGTTQVMVATVAFGMGIDKQGVRFVVHHSLPKSIESYYQESGRAGRDGDVAESVVLYRPADVTRLSCLLAENPNRENNLKKLYELALYMDPPKQECRRKAMADYFGDTWQQSDCAQHCDLCTTARAGVDHAEVARHLVHIAAACTEPNLTAIKLCEALCSDNQASKKIRGTTPAPMKGRAADVAGIAERVVSRLLHSGHLIETFSLTSYGCNSYLKAAQNDFSGEVTLLPFKGK